MKEGILMPAAYEAEVEPEYTEEEIEEKWYGVPPAGERAPPSGWKYLGSITLVLLFEFALWAVYRALTADFYGQFGSYWFYVGHIIAAPTIHLGPILLYWVFIRKERLFVRSDLENGKYMSFSFGPFKMTRKLLFTAVLVGLFGGIIWRMAEFIVFDTTSVMLGGSEFGTLTLFNVFSGEEIPLFLLMTFVMFFIVGPVEEFEFRSFVHDQSQRVIPKWAALIFSSVFFGLSHIPIAVFVYKLPLTELIFAEISWMSAGLVLGAIYMWSRNIFAAIIMHGIGNWQLSVYFWQSAVKDMGLSSMEVNIASLMTSIFANGLVILIFYLIHRYYWQPQRRGEAAFGGALLSLQSKLFKHDNGSRSVASTVSTLTIISILTLSLILGGTVALGSTNFEKLAPSEKDTETQGIDLSNMQEITDTFADSRFLGEGESYTYTFNSTGDRILKGVNVQLSWEDEKEKPGRPTLRRYTNQPDTFQLDVIGPDPNLTVTQTDSNEVGAAAHINLVLEIPDEIILEKDGSFNVDVNVLMVDAGMWTGRSFLGFRDDGNEYDIIVELSYLDIMSETTAESS